MAVWVDRAGKHGEHQERFLQSSRIYLTWGILQEQDLNGYDQPQIRTLLQKALPQASNGKIGSHGSQVFTFVARMKPGDIVITPLSGRATVAIGEIAGEYHFENSGDFMYRHSRTVRWIATDVSRSRLDADVRQSLCGMQTIFEIKLPDIDRRIRALGAGVSTADVAPIHAGSQSEIAPSGSGPLDLERRAYDDIGDLILRKFKGRGFERLIEGILAAQGYHTYRSPEGPDKGVDLLVAPGPLGFGSPRICVQVKCTEAPIDHPTLSQLLGTMQNVKAQQGLLVSWGGFKSSVERVRADHFFTVRLWDQDDVIRELLANYDKLDPDLKAELPLKQIWIVNQTEDA